MKLTQTVMVLGLALVGCASNTASTQRLVARRAPRIQSATSREDHSRCDATSAGRTATEYDTNDDGVPDVRKVYQVVGEGRDRHSVLVCREVDLNHDGTKDIFRFYNNEGRTLREEEDRDFDGRLDVITYFENGEVVKREFDTNADGMIDMRLFFRDHQPYRAERELQADSSPDFHPDYWEFYDNHGQVDRIGWDYDHDGRADRWDRRSRVGASAPSGALDTSPTPPAAPTAPGATPAATAPTAASPTPAAAPTAAPAAATARTP